jgi:ribosomal protein S18 acetylase RimI-like enzyme
MKFRVFTFLTVLPFFHLPLASATSLEIAVQEIELFQSCIQSPSIQNKSIRLTCESHHSSETNLQAHYRIDEVGTSHPVGTLRLQLAVDQRLDVPYLQILWIEIEEEHQNRGLATSVIQLLKSQAASTQVKFILASVNESDDAAFHLYLKTGFQEDPTSESELVQMKYLIRP